MDFFKFFKTNAFFIWFLFIASGVQGQFYSTSNYGGIVVTSYINEPFLMMSATRQSYFEGFIADLAEKLFDKLGLSYHLRRVVDGKYGKRDNDTGQWNGMVGELLTNRSDMALADLSETSARAAVVDFSVPFMSSQLAILMKTSKRDGGTTNSEGHWSTPFLPWLNPMTTGFWVAFIIVSIILMFVIFFVEKTVSRKLSKIQPPPEESIFAHFGTRVFGIPSSIATRVLQVTFCLFILICFCAYVSNFAADKMLELAHESERRLPLGIDTVVELLERDDIEVGVMEGGSTYDYFQASQNPSISKLKEKIQKTGAWIDKYERGIQRVRNSNGNFGFIMESPSAEYAITRKPCDLSIVPNFFGPQKGFAVAIPKHSTKLVMNKLNSAILKLSEEGVLDHLAEKWFKDQTECEPDKKQMEVNRAYDPMTLGNLASLFILLTISVFLIFIIAAVETALNRRAEQAT